MHIICLTPLAPGVYNDFKADHITAPPDGWAYIPEDFPLPSTFPRLGSIEAEERIYTREENGRLVPIQQPYDDPYDEPNGITVMTVTGMTEGTLPEPVEPEQTQLDRVEAQVTYTAMMTDTLLEV